jgi:S1-C subfamily serine protease
MMQIRSRNAWVSIGAMVVMAAFLAFPPGVASAQPDEQEPAQKVYQNTAHSFVIVSYHLKKSDRPYMNGAGPEFGPRSVLQYILNKNALDTVGVILNDQGEIFTFEREPMYRETVDRITVQGPDGTVVPARAGRLLVKAPGRIVQLEGRLPAGWQPLACAEQGEVTPETKLYVATLGADKEYHIYVKPCAYGCSWGGSADPGPCLQVPDLNTAGVLCNAEGRPVGVTCLDQLDLGPGGPAWRAKDILADAGVSDEQQKQLEDKIQHEFARNIYEIRIMPRLEPEDEEYGFGGRFRFRSRYADPEDGEEMLVYGLGFADNRLLIPEALDKELVAKIDTITVKVDDRDVPARFGGVLRACAATVIELQEGKLPHVAAFPADGKVPRVEPFWSAFASELAGMDVRTEVGRWVDKGQGYEDKWYPVLEKPVAPGSWLLDRQGRLIGFFGAARYEHTRLEPYLLGSDVGRYRPYASPYARMRRSMMMMAQAWRSEDVGDLRLFDGSEMTKILGDLPANYDPHIRHLAKDEQKRRVWLGVEYTALDKEMVKQMGLREPTQDGRIGLVVNRVYADSPAARMGLAEGDVLLKLAVPGAPWPIELAAHEGEGPMMPEMDEADIPREFAAMGMQMPRRRPWPSEDNYLNQLLGDVGQGTTVQLSYLHGTEVSRASGPGSEGGTASTQQTPGWAVVEKEFTIEQAPRDMLSAAKYKDEKLGLTAKDVTYEVRAALRLKPDEPAVVVTKVERGTPTALARINPYELIRAVDGTPVDNVGTLEKLITQAQEARKDSVRLTVEWMGKTRLADLKLEAPAAPGGLLDSLLPGR